MATVVGPNWKVKIPAPQGMMGVTLPIFSETFTPGALNDIRKLVKIPRGLTFTAETFFQVSDQDTGGPTLVYTLRATDDGIAFKTLIHQSAAGGTGGLARPTKAPATEDAIGFTTTNHKWWVELLVATAATTAASGTFVYGIGLSGFYKSGAIDE